MVLVQDELKKLKFIKKIKIKIIQYKTRGLYQTPRQNKRRIWIF
jgi:hypothetical protein